MLKNITIVTSGDYNLESFNTDDELYKNIRKRLKKDLDRKRYVHTKGVADVSLCLAMSYGVDMKKAYLAGLLHDNAKCIPTDEKRNLCKKYQIVLNTAEEKNPELIHAKLGAYRLKDVFHIDDEDIFSAIACHTTGKPEMSVLDKILYIADYIEPNRRPLPMLDEVRKLAFRNLDQAILLILESTLSYLKDKSAELDIKTQETYHYYKKLLSKQEEI